MTEDRIDKDLGQASEITMEQFLRDLVDTMFKMDNDVGILKTRLDNGTDPSPVVTIEIRIKDIALDKGDQD